LSDATGIFTAVALWFVLTFLGLLLPTLTGLVFFMFVAPIIIGYVAGRNRKASIIVIISLITTVLAGIIGFATIGSVPLELQRNLTGIGWTSNTLILVWVFLNASLTLITGYVTLKSSTNNSSVPK